jgi:hypothetical protein
VQKLTHKYASDLRKKKKKTANCHSINDMKEALYGKGKTKAFFYRNGCDTHIIMQTRKFELV